ncbi:hypothetical protein Pla52o_42720 [Novipirellula galeiformis]|uniref:Uncharacterized protein n=1 Tax=Novipirellula galeiformis TaxID=2528004 RepID=A0A5C6C8R7_9BACT|nr:hypothetical protein Pla52o_42720 [Novipirellula galeiformis]
MDCIEFSVMSDHRGHLASIRSITVVSPPGCTEVRFDAKLERAVVPGAEASARGMISRWLRGTVTGREVISPFGERRFCLVLVDAFRN